jgi:ribose/xylose/arabinose/galactoside ABC-type transport system permease subunit
MNKKLYLQRLNRFGLVLALLAIYLLFVFIAPASFSTMRNLETIARQTVIVGIAAIGMTFVIISGGIDLSVGSIVALSSVLTAWFLNYAGFSPLSAAVCAVIVTGLFGLFSGILITRLRVVPFIVTLGMMLLCRGAAKGIAAEQKINAPYTWLNEILASLPPERSWLMLSPGVWALIFLAVIFAFILRYTVFGRATVAIGSNELTARLCGIPVERTKVIIYSLNALLASIAGVMQFSRLTVGDPTVAVGLELDVIAAVVIGGGSLSGGQGTIFGSLIGALIMTIIRSGCTQMGLANWIQEIVTGAIIIIAVALDRLRHRKSAEL